MASYTPITNTLNFSVALNPTSAFPIDARSMFGSYQEAAAAAATAEMAGSTNTKYYIGERLTVVENDVVKHYSIQADKTLKEDGTEVLGDDKTIVVGDDQTLGLKSFGVEYFAYIDADNIVTGDYSYPDNMPDEALNTYVKINDVWYVKGADGWEEAAAEPVTSAYYELTTGWKSGLEPKVIQSDAGVYELAWYEPSSTTVEGLQSMISNLQNDVSVLDNRLTTTETDLESKIAQNTQAIAVLNGDATTEGSVKKQITDAISLVMDNPDEAKNSIQELVDWIDNHAADALELSNNVTANATAINALETLVGTLPEGASATTVIGYISEAITNEMAKLGTAAWKNVEDFATAEQGAKADSAVQTVEAGSTNGTILVDGVSVTVYTPKTASVTESGEVKVDGSSITSNDEGVISVAAVDSSKVTGLDTALTAATESAVTESKEYADETFVKTESISGTTNAAGSVEAASDAKVVSEKLFMASLEWKTTM